MSRACEVNPPDAEFFLADFATGSIGVRLEPVDPMREGARVMLAQGFRVDDFQSFRGQALDARADIYSFGATAFEIVTGRPPFRAGTPEDLLNKHLFEKPPSPAMFNPEISKEFAEFVLRLLAKRREDRPNNFHEALMQFRNIRVFKGQTVKKEGER